MNAEETKQTFDELNSKYNTLCGQLGQASYHAALGLQECENLKREISEVSKAAQALKAEQAASTKPVEVEDGKQTH